MDGFSQLCLESIGIYVYALVDPRVRGSTLDKVFYVGKGKGDRCHQHARAEGKAIELSRRHLKLATIRDIRKATGAPPPVFIVAHSLSEEEALRLEAILIATLGVRLLTNAVRGQGDRNVWLPADEIDARFAGPVPRSTIAGTVLFVSLNGGHAGPPYPDIKADPDTLRSRTLAWWPLPAAKVERVDVVVGVYRGLTRCAYRTDKDEAGRAVITVKPPGKKRARSRVEFRGELLPDWPHLLRRVEDEAGTVLTMFRPKSACRMV